MTNNKIQELNIFWIPTFFFENLVQSKNGIDLRVGLDLLKSLPSLGGH